MYFGGFHFFPSFSTSILFTIRPTSACACWEATRREEWREGMFCVGTHPSPTKQLEQESEEKRLRDSQQKKNKILFLYGFRQSQVGFHNQGTSTGVLTGEAKDERKIR
jgi:hypothetical protein